jgi:hypothetical protein
VPQKTSFFSLLAACTAAGPPAIPTPGDRLRQKIPRAS